MVSPKSGRILAPPIFFGVWSNLNKLKTADQWLAVDVPAVLSA